VTTIAEAKAYRGELRRVKASEKRAGMLWLYESDEKITIGDVAEKFGCSERWTAALLRRARLERKYKRIHEKA